MWYTDFVNTPAKNGESLVDLAKRVRNFLSQLMQKHKNDTAPAVVVTHAGVIRVIHATLNASPLKDMFDLKLEYGAVVKLHFD